MSSEQERLTRLETTVCDIKEDMTEIKDVVGKIKDNHLVHLQAGVDGLKLQQAWFAGVGAAILFAIEYFK